jgi:hypothetical protein
MNNPRSVQNFCNQYLNPVTPLIIDGRIGILSRGLMKRAVQKLRDEFEVLGYIWGSNNFIGVRMNTIFTDLFDDFFVLIINDEIVDVVPCSTKAGVLGMRTNSNYWYNGLQGVAILKEGQYIDTWQFVKGGWSGLPYWQQVLPVTIYRDNNNDFNVDYIQEQVGLFGINIHSWIGYNFNRVTNLSTGCQVAQMSLFSTLLRLNQMFPNRLTYTLLAK